MHVSIHILMLSNLNYAITGAVNIDGLLLLWKVDIISAQSASI
jgi:hypothetical protein